MRRFKPGTMVDVDDPTSTYEKMLGVVRRTNGGLVWVDLFAAKSSNYPDGKSRWWYRREILNELWRGDPDCLTMIGHEELVGLALGDGLCIPEDL